MKLICEGSEYVFKAGGFRVSECILLEQLTGMKFKDWLTEMGEGSPVAIKGLVYLLKLRAGERPDWTSLDFDLSEVDMEDDEPPVPPAAGAGNGRSRKTATATSAS